MNRKYILLSIVVIIIISLALFFNFKKYNQELLGYENRVHGFTLEYPNSLTIKENGSNFISIGSINRNIFRSEANVRILESTNESEYANFDAFILDTMRQLCFAETPTETMFCDNVISRESIKNVNDLNGEIITINFVREQRETGEKKSARWGSHYIFNMNPLEKNNEFKALIIEAPFGISERHIDQKLLLSIAESLSIINEQ
jgi:hypothetical protein